MGARLAQPSAAVAHAGEQPPAAVEPPAAVVFAGGSHLRPLCAQGNSHLRLASHPWLSRGYPQLSCTQGDGHLRLASHLRPLQAVLRFMQSGAVAESAAGVDGGLGATEPGVSEWLFRGESLVPVA